MFEFSLKKFYIINYLLIASILLAALFLTRNIINLSFSKKGHYITTEDKADHNIAYRRKEIVQYAPILEKNPFGPPLKFRKLQFLQDVTEKKQRVLPSDLILVGTVTGPEELSYAIFEFKSKSNQEVFAHGEEVYDYGTLIKVDRESVKLRLGANIYTIPLTDASLYQGHSRANTKIMGRNPPRTSFVKKIGDREYLLDRRRVEQALENPEQILTDARLLPNIQGGKQMGFKMYEVKPGGLYESLGLKNGDILLRVNGLEISNPEVAIQALSALRGMNSINLDIIRNGTRMTLSYRIR